MRARATGATRELSMVDERDPSALFEDFWELWLRLVSDAQHAGTVVVVEGERDRRSLRRLGLRGEILLVHRGRTISETAHQLAETSRHAILLTDWDTEGGHLAQRLKEFLGVGRNGADLEYRRRFARVLKGELVHVEGLYGWARRTAEASGRSLALLVEAVESSEDAAKE